MTIIEEYNKWNNGRIKEMSACIITDISTIIIAYLDLYRIYIKTFETLGQFIVFYETTKHYDIDTINDILENVDYNDIDIVECSSCSKKQYDYKGDGYCFDCTCLFCYCCNLTNLKGEYLKRYTYGVSIENCKYCGQDFCVQCYESNDIGYCSDCFSGLIKSSELYKDLLSENVKLKLKLNAKSK